VENCPPSHGCILGDGGCPQPLAGQNEDLIMPPQSSAAASEADIPPGPPGREGAWLTVTANGDDAAWCSTSFRADTHLNCGGNCQSLFPNSNVAVRSGAAAKLPARPVYETVPRCLLHLNVVSGQVVSQ
jgi:hypothetical protein